jgi:hypothetical protein
MTSVYENTRVPVKMRPTGHLDRSDPSPRLFYRWCNHNSADAPELSARCSRSEREFEFPRGIVYSVSRLLVIRVDVCEPAYSTANDILQVIAVLIQEAEVGLWRSVKFPSCRYVALMAESTHLFTSDACDSIGAVWLNTF